MKAREQTLLFKGKCSVSDGSAGPFKGNSTYGKGEKLEEKESLLLSILDVGWHSDS